MLTKGTTTTTPSELLQEVNVGVMCADEGHYDPSPEFRVACANM